MDTAVEEEAGSGGTYMHDDEARPQVGVALVGRAPAPGEEKADGSGGKNSTIVPRSTVDFQKRRAPLDPKTLIRRWLDDSVRDQQGLASILRSATAAGVYDFETKLMKEVLVAIEHPMESFSREKCREALIGIFFSSSSELGDTPVLSRSSSVQDGDFQTVATPQPTQPAHESLFDSAASLLRPAALQRVRIREQVEPERKEADVRLELQLERNRREMDELRQSMQGEIDRRTKQLRTDFQSELRSWQRPGGGQAGSSGMPAAGDFFSAIASATRESVADGSDPGPGLNEPAGGWAFHANAPGGPLTAHRIETPSTNIHSRKGGSESLWPEVAEQFFPLEAHMRSHMGAWANVSLFREAITHAVALDKLALLPKTLDSNKALQDAREVMVRRWLCLKWVSARTERKASPSFPAYAIAFESLLTTQDVVPASATITAMANSRYLARAQKSQSGL
jgi:hypothetical protein